MNKEQFNKEWDFITEEIHSHKPTKCNALKREILFTLQHLLSLEHFDFYFKAKQVYLSNITT